MGLDHNRPHSRSANAIDITGVSTQPIGLMAMIKTQLYALQGEDTWYQELLAAPVGWQRKDAPLPPP